MKTKLKLTDYKGQEIPLERVRTPQSLEEKIKRLIEEGHLQPVKRIWWFWVYRAVKDIANKNY